MAVRKFCLDTYALVELDKGNPRYRDINVEERAIPDLILVEFYGVLLREQGERVAEYWRKKLEPFVVRVELDLLFAAVQFRRVHRKKRLSFFDAVGYMYSLHNGYHFVTGDKEFKHFKKVEYRKAA